MRLDLGPVFAFEWLTTARNWRVYALRVVFGTGLLLILWIVASSGPDYVMRGGQLSIPQQAEAGRTFAASIITTQLALMLLIAPAATAGSLCLDKSRGTLAHVLATDLTNPEIILGKLGAKLLPCLGLVFSTLGMMAIATLMGGIDPRALTGATLVTLGVTVLGASLSLTISVWASKTHEVVMASYLTLIAWLLFYPVWWMLSFVPMGWMKLTTPPEWVGWVHPFVTLLNVRSGEFPVERHSWFLVGCLGVSALLLGLAIARLRSVAIRQMNRPSGVRSTGWRWNKRIGFWLSPTLDGNPVLWREWHRRSPSRWTRAIWWVYTVSSLGFSGLGAYIVVTSPLISPAAMIAMFPINGFQVAIGLLLVSVTAATSLADERSRGSLDVLLATSLSTREIVSGKWWGAFRVVPMLAILPAALAAWAGWWFSSQENQPTVGVPPQWTVWLGPFLLAGLTVSYGAAITSFGLVAATWIKRLDRAVIATVATYLLVCVAWPITMAILFKNDNIHGPGAASASPFFGIGYTGSVMNEQFRRFDDQWEAQTAWATFWILANLSFSALLLKFELSRFNGKLGRTPDEGMPQRRASRRARKPKSKPAPASDPAGIELSSVA